jgi:hypothetical protein
VGSLSTPVLVRTALLVAVAVAPFVLLRSIADDGGALAALGSVGQLVTFIAGGAVAARRAPTQPVTHAMVGVFLGWAAFQLVAIVVQVLVGDDVRWAALPFLAVFVAGTGTVGGLLGTWRRAPDRAH